MPIQPTYPGVYIQEVPGGVKTITGVSTSICAFIGTAKRGPVNKAVNVHSFSDFERRFGGLAADSEMSYAARQFFINGGTNAWVVRLVKSAASAKLTLKNGAGPDNVLIIHALDPGDSGNKITVKIDHEDVTNSSFNVTVEFKLPGDPNDGLTEKYLNVNMINGDPRNIGRLVDGISQLISIEIVKELRPKAITDNLAGGNETGFTNAEAIAVYEGTEKDRTGIYAFEEVDIFNILCLPGVSNSAILSKAEAYCRGRRAFLIADIPDTTKDAEAMKTLVKGTSLPKSDHAAVYYPWIRISDPLNGGKPRSVAPSGTIAGLYARTDSSRGVWKAPAGTEATLNGVQGVDYLLTDTQNGTLNPLGVNCIRIFPVYGAVSWGARTLRGNDQMTSEYKYIPVRRLALFLEESLYRGLKWVVFEPNDEQLWAQIRLNAGAFMQNLFRQGAFQGQTPKEAYFVKCDRETTTQNDINQGVVNIWAGFAPLKPAEFVILHIQQIAGKINQ